MKTLSDFSYDGRVALDFLIKKSPWGSIDQAIASLTVFAHPEAVTASGQRAIFRTVRDIARRGQVINGVVADDNSSPAVAFEWATGFKRSAGSDLTCCHIYAASRDPTAYTDLRNLFFAPSFISKLTDSQATILPPNHILHILRYRAFDLYGYRGPAEAKLPEMPDVYGSLEWAEAIGAGANATDLELRMRTRLARKPRDRITKSVALCGWTFSDYKPDSRVVFTGS